MNTPTQTQTTTPPTKGTPSTDRIEKEILLHAPRARVWRALTDTAEFSAWFGVKLVGAFTPGARLSGNLTFGGYEHVTLEVDVAEVQPERLFSYRWHPYALDPKVDYASEPTTLVEFRLEEAEGGTRLTVVESGFDRLPADRRATAFRMNNGGWDAQLANVARHVSR